MYYNLKPEANIGQNVDYKGAIFKYCVHIHDFRYDFADYVILLDWLSKLYRISMHLFNLLVSDTDPVAL